MSFTGDNCDKIPRQQERPLNEKGGIKENAIIDILPLAAFGMVQSLEGGGKGERRRGNRN
jgi:hypothetical protein